MSASYFIGPYEPAEWETAQSNFKVDPTEYQQALSEQWPKAIFYRDPSQYHLLEWHIPSESDVSFIGRLHSNEQIVSFGLRGDYLDFVLWYRTYVPISHQLFLFRSSSWEALELTTETTPEDIANFMKRV